jgi:hypothetical protein
MSTVITTVATRPPTTARVQFNRAIVNLLRGEPSDHSAFAASAGQSGEQREDYEPITPAHEIRLT